jgi:hypothetical protein
LSYIIVPSCAVQSVMWQFLGRPVNVLLPGGPATARTARARVPLDSFGPRTCVTSAAFNPSMLLLLL